MYCEILNAVQKTYGNPWLRCDGKCEETDECPFVNNKMVFPKTDVVVYDSDRVGREDILG